MVSYEQKLEEIDDEEAKVALEWLKLLESHPGKAAAFYKEYGEVIDRVIDALNKPKRREEK